MISPTLKNTLDSSHCLLDSIFSISLKNTLSLTISRTLSILLSLEIQARNLYRFSSFDKLLSIPLCKNTLDFFLSRNPKLPIFEFFWKILNRGWNWEILNWFHGWIDAISRRVLVGDHPRFVIAVSRWGGYVWRFIVAVLIGRSCMATHWLLRICVWFERKYYRWYTNGRVIWFFIWRRPCWYEKKILLEITEEVERSKKYFLELEDDFPLFYRLYLHLADVILFTVCAVHIMPKIA